jgi:hypothetical protein
VTAFGGFTGTTDVACDGDTIAVRHSAGVELFSRDAASWSRGPQFVIAADTHPVVRKRLALHDDLLVVGNPLDSSAAQGVDGDPTSDCMNLVNCASESGAVHVFEQNAIGTWQQAAYLKASNAQANALFGVSVDVHAGTVLVGAQQEASSQAGASPTAADYDCAAQPTTCASGTGAAYLYERASGTWQEVAYVKREQPEIGANFGAPVTVFGDLFVVGTVYDFEFAASGGAATLFHRDENGITELQTFAAPDAATDDYFPRTAELNEDGLACSAFNRQPGVQDKVFWYGE